MSEYGWIDAGNGRQVFRRIDTSPAPARSSLPCPMVMGDTLPEPVQSHADGRFYSSKAALRATYLPSGNPQGERYIEVGNDPARLRPRERPKADRKAIRETVQRSVARFKAGERVKGS